MAELSVQIDAIKAEIDVRIEKAVSEAKNASESSSQKVSSDLKAEINTLLVKMNDIQERIDKTETEANRPGMSGKSTSFAGMVQKGLEDNRAALQHKAQKGGIDFNFSVKVVGDMSSAVNLTGMVVQPDFRPGILDFPRRDIHVRQFMNVGTTTSNVIYYQEENGPGEGTPGMVAEGALKPQIDFDFVQKMAPVKKIAAHIRVPEEMIEDIPYLVSYITMKGINRLKLIEDSQILFGDGLGNNLQGITTVASPFAAGTLIVQAPQMIDSIRAAVLQVRVAEYAATAGMVSPESFAKMELTKDSTGNYLLVNVLQNGLPTLWRLPIIESTAIPNDRFLVGDFQLGAQIVDRQGVNVRLYDQDRDNAIRNLVTIVIEERLALPIYRPAAFVYGTFSTAITDLAT